VAQEVLVGGTRDGLYLGHLVRGQLGRAQILGAPDLVPRLVVEQVLLLRPHLYRRQRLTIEERHRELAAVDVALEQDPVVVAEGRHQRLRYVVASGGEAHSERRPLSSRLDDQWEPEAGLDLVERVS